MNAIRDSAEHDHFLAMSVDKTAVGEGETHLIEREEILVSRVTLKVSDHRPPARRMSCTSLAPFNLHKALSGF